MPAVDTQEGLADFATKADLDDLATNADLRTEIAEVKAAMASLERRLRTENTEGRTELRTRISEVDIGMINKIGEMERRLRTENTEGRTELRTRISEVDIGMINKIGEVRVEMASLERRLCTEISEGRIEMVDVKVDVGFIKLIGGGILLVVYILFLIFA
ncbi:MAG: hypothetical protein GDA52_04695 [Rhodobacteraceae bacterium]|nr:hypothetical protein [Paracoccaceae bacterium]